jgi:hypothetical protein
VDALVLQGRIDIGLELDEVTIESTPESRKQDELCIHACFDLRDHESDLFFEYRGKGSSIRLVQLYSLGFIRKDEKDPDRASTSTSSEQSLSMAKQWLGDCVKDHIDCNPSEKEVNLPTRLVQVSPNLRLVMGESLPRNTQYIALSHCWGLEPIYTLRQSTLCELLESIPMEEFPKIF